MTRNVHLLLCRLNDWKNEVNGKICSHEIIELRTVIVDIVCNPVYLGHDRNEYDSDFSA